METVATEEVDVSMAEDVDEEVDKVEGNAPNAVVKGAVTHMKMELTYQMSPVTLKIQSGPHSQTI